MAYKNGESYRIKKGNLFNDNKVLATLLIGAGVGIALALIFKKDKVFELVDKSRNSAKDLAVDLVKKAEDGFSSFSKSKGNNAENKFAPENVG